MAGGFPYGFESCLATTYGANTSTSAGTPVTGNTSTNSMGPWVQIGANTTNDICFVIVDLDCSNSKGYAALLNLGIGASGSVNAIVKDLSVCPTANSDLTEMQDSMYAFPLQIKANNAIWAQCQGSTASEIILVSVIGMDGGFAESEGCGGVDTYGSNTTASFGTAIDPGATINTKGTWVSMSASLPNDICGLFGNFDNQGSSSTGTVKQETFLVDIGIGVSGSQNTIISNFPYSCARYATTYVGNPNDTGIPFIPINIPAGTALWARAQCSSNTATYRIVGLTLYGVWA